MIKPHCFQKEWIDGFKAQDAYSRINPPLLEKMIHALSLLQYLQTLGLKFIFKGGTSLILLLEDSNRFSVDIDIITEESRETIEGILDNVIVDSHFRGWKLDAKRSYNEGVPKAHYEFEYASNVNKNSNYILLDILFEKAHYPNIQKRPIQSMWIETETIIEIMLPTIEAIAGDKLTAFAPTTTGILYKKGKELEIIKQLFDLGKLFEQIQSVREVALSFEAFALQELEYRKLIIPSSDILKDTLNTCKIISYREKNRTEPEKTNFAELQNGIKAFGGNFLIVGNFRIGEAVTASSKVAYLCAKLLVKDFTPILKYGAQDMSKIDIKSQDWNGLNSLKRFPDQSAFFYWYKCLEILGKLENPVK